MTSSSHAFLAATFALTFLAPTAPVAGGAPTCDGIPLVGTPEEIAATPRDDAALEQLALSMGGGVTADPYVYGRVTTEIELIRALVPEVADIGYTPRRTADDLILGVDAATLAAIDNGTYSAWDCLNEYYGFRSLRVIGRLFPTVLLTLKGVYDTTRLAPLYAALPGVESAGPNGIGGDGSTVCGLADSSSTYHYFFDEAHGDCLAGCIYHDVSYFTTSSNGALPEFRGRWANDSGVPRPPWYEIYQECRFGTVPLAADIDVAPAEPDAATPVTLAISGANGNSACGPFPDGYEYDPTTATIRVTADYNASCGTCTPDTTPYYFEVDLAPLAAGDYHVGFFRRDGCGGSETLQALTELSVGPAPAAESCAGGNRPAATLLVPYFEVDLADPEGPDTVFSVANAGAEPVIAHVVLWTDWGLPTLAFDLLLRANDLQTLDLREILGRGQLPSTGPVPGCADSVARPELDGEALADLQARHTGRPSPVDGLCHGSRRPAAELAVGYVTVDAMNGCSASVRHPSDGGYFVHGGTGLASNRNVLWGDVFYVSSADDSAQSVEAVPIVADATLYGDFPHFSFYSGWVDGDGRDDRVPLGHRYRSRFLRGGRAGMATEVIYWTEGFGAAGEPRDCAEPFPEHLPNDVRLVASFHDEEGAAAGTALTRVDERTRKITVGEEPLVPEKGFGQIDLMTGFNCNVCGSPMTFSPIQTWMTTVLRAAGRFSAAQHATRLEGACSSGAE